MRRARPTRLAVARIRVRSSSASGAMESRIWNLEFGIRDAFFSSGLERQARPEPQIPLSSSRCRRDVQGINGLTAPEAKHIVTLVNPLNTTLRTRCRLVGCSTLIAAMALAVGLRAETGYDLWLRYAGLMDPIPRSYYRRADCAQALQAGSPTYQVI